MIDKTNLLPNLTSGNLILKKLLKGDAEEIAK
jgi:hypothetical protein